MNNKCLLITLILSLFASYMDAGQFSDFLVCGDLAFSEGIIFDMSGLPVLYSLGEERDGAIDNVDNNATNCLEAISSRKFSDNDLNHVRIVGDIVAMNLISICGLDSATRFSRQMSRVAWYRVSVHVRWHPVDFPSAKNFAFAISYVEGLPEWIYYKGMTLEFDVSRINGVWRMNSAMLVAPFPPFERDGIKTYFGDYESGRREICLFCNICGLRFDENRPTLLVRYPDGMTILFRSGSLVTNANYVGKFYDFTNSELYLQSDSSSTADSYWKGSWISVAKNGDAPFAMRLDSQTDKE